METISIILADDHTVVTEGMRAVLKSDSRFNVCGIFKDANSLLDYLENNQIDMIILDIDIPGAEKLNLLQNIKMKYPKTKIVIFTMHVGIQYFFEARKLGADSYVLKTESITFFPTILIQVSKGIFYCSEELKIHLSGKNKKDIIKPAENEILSLLSKGLHYNEIAEKIGKSEKTIEYYIYKLRKKHNVNSNIELLLKLSNQIIN